MLNTANDDNVDYTRERGLVLTALSSSSGAAMGACRWRCCVNGFCMPPNQITLPAEEGSYASRVKRVRLPPQYRSRTRWTETDSLNLRKSPNQFPITISKYQ